MQTQARDDEDDDLPLDYGPERTGGHSGGPAYSRTSGLGAGGGNHASSAGQYHGEDGGANLGESCEPLALT